MNENTKLILDKLQELGENTWEVDTVTKGTVMAKSLNFKQQKELISTIADGTLGGLKLQKVLNTIVLDNVGDGFTVLDRLPIIIVLRSKTIGSIYKIDGVEVDLDKIYKKITKIKYPKSPIIKKHGLTISLQPPSIVLDNAVVFGTIEALKREKDELSKNIQDIYTYEIVKYIDTIEFGSDVLKFEDISLSEKYKIVENLPISVNNEITQYIQKLKSLEKGVLSYEKDGEIRYFDIDASFFDS